MLGWLVITACVGLLAGAGWFVGRVGREWMATIEQCREALGGELTPGNLLLPPRLWRRSDDGLSLVIGLSTSGEGGRKIATRTLGGARAWVASTRLAVDGDGIPGDLRIRSKRAAAEHVAIEGRRVSTGIADLDRRLHLEGGVNSVLSRLGGARRAAIVAAVAQGASLSHGIWVIERTEPVTRAEELIGLARLLLAAAQATQARGTIAEERLLDSVCRDPEPGFRRACLDCLTMRRGMWRARAIEAGLVDPEPEMRLRAAQAAGVQGRTVLIALAREAPDDVRLAAIATLAADDGPEVRALLEELALEAHAGVRAAALAGMARLGHAPIELLRCFARHPDPELRIRALKALRPAGAIAIEQAIVALDDPNARVVLTAVELLGARADTSVLPRLRAVRPAALDSALKAAIDRALTAIAARPVPVAVGALALAGPDRAGAGRLTLDDEVRGRLSQEQGAGEGAVTRPDCPDLFAEPSPSGPSGAPGAAPDDLFAQTEPLVAGGRGRAGPPEDLFAESTPVHEPTTDQAGPARPPAGEVSRIDETE